MSRILLAFFAIYILLFAAGCQQQVSETIEPNDSISRNQLQIQEAANQSDKNGTNLDEASSKAVETEQKAVLTMEDLQLGSLKLNMTLEQLSKEIPAQPVRVMTDDAILQEIRFYEGFEIRLQGEEITYISTTSDQYPTPKGLKVGDSTDKLLEIYGAPAQIYNNIYSYSISDEYYVFHAEIKDGKIIRIQVNLVC